MLEARLRSHRQNSAFVASPFVNFRVSIREGERAAGTVHGTRAIVPLGKDRYIGIGAGIEITVVDAIGVFVQCAEDVCWIGDRACL